MKKYLIGIGCGFLVGLIDLIPMLVQNLTWDANLSALSMWMVIGFLLTMIEWNINSAVKGIIISLLVLLPSAILIGWQEPISLLPVFFMTILLGGTLGYFVNKLIIKK